MIIQPNIWNNPNPQLTSIRMQQQSPNTGSNIASITIKLPRQLVISHTLKAVNNPITIVSVSLNNAAEPNASYHAEELLLRFITYINNHRAVEQGSIQLFTIATELPPCGSPGQLPDELRLARNQKKCQIQIMHTAATTRMTEESRPVDLFYYDHETFTQVKIAATSMLQTPPKQTHLDNIITAALGNPAIKPRILNAVPHEYQNQIQTYIYQTINIARVIPHVYPFSPEHLVNILEHAIRVNTNQHLNPIASCDVSRISTYCSCRQYEHIGDRKINAFEFFPTSYKNVYMIHPRY